MYTQKKEHDSTKIRVKPKKIIIQRKTKIEHKTEKVTFGAGESNEVGVKMTAWLNPKKAMVGTSTGNPQLALYKAVQNKTSVPMIRGHLLNHDLGGFGVAQNLYPITSSANSKHKTNVENPVGDELFKADKTAGLGIYYEVNVKGVKNTAKDIAENNASFVFKAYKVTGMTHTSTGTKGTKFIDTEIISNPKESNTNKKLRGQAIALNGTTLKKTKKKVLPNWDHKGRSGGLIEFKDKFNITAAPNGSAIQKKPITEHNKDEIDAVLYDLKNIRRDIIEQREDDIQFWKEPPNTELLLSIESYRDFIESGLSLKEDPLFEKKIDIGLNTPEELSIYTDKLTEYLGMYLNFMEYISKFSSQKDRLIAGYEHGIEAHYSEKDEGGRESSDSKRKRDEDDPNPKRRREEVEEVEE